MLTTPHHAINSDVKKSTTEDGVKVPINFAWPKTSHLFAYLSLELEWTVFILLRTE